MKVSIEYYQVQKEFRSVLSRAFPILVQLRQSGDKVSFNELLLEIVPQVRQYINTRLNTAIKKGHFSRNKYKSDDFIDQLFIEIYDHIEEIEDESGFYTWLFTRTNELLEDTIVEEEFDEYFFKNIDDYSKPEWDEMEEKFSTDGNGELMMIEELDDISYPKNDYALNHVFLEDKEKGIIAKLDKEVNEERIQKHIKMVMHNLPLSMRTVIDLFSKQGFSIDEIATIRNTTTREVEKLLEDARAAIQRSLSNRFVND